VAELIANEFKNDNIVFYNLPNVNYADDGNEFATQLQSQLTAQRRDFKTIDVVDEQSIIIESGKRSIVFFNTDKFSLISAYINTLSTLSNANEIVMFEQYSWQNTNTQNLKTFSISPFKSDINGVELRRYNNNFSSSFDWKPSSKAPRYDLLGYDLTNYFISQIYRNGSNFNAGKNKLPVSAGIQSQFKFERSSERTGYMNKQIYFLQQTK